MTDPLLWLGMAVGIIVGYSLRVTGGRQQIADLLKGLGSGEHYWINIGVGRDFNEGDDGGDDVEDPLPSETEQNYRYN